MATNKRVEEIESRLKDKENLGRNSNVRKLRQFQREILETEKELLLGQTKVLKQT